MIPLRFIGDVHGQIHRYVPLCRAAEHTVQVGDLGFRRHYAAVIDQLDPARHRFIPGNHDDYGLLPPHCLGDFGVHEAAGVEMFFVRGALSIDKNFRTPQLDWWPEEELTQEQLDAAIREYERVKPQLVVTHDCPLSVSPIVGDATVLRAFGFEEEPRTRTQLALQAMLEIHPPARWIFGHYHRDTSFEHSGVYFTCLAELSVLDL
ncbi:MAG: metallophosphoesterase [Planctomycetes bacterium]|nr:metallophosphoesterase [Planctomycetota bacterium]